MFANTMDLVNKGVTQGILAITIPGQLWDLKLIAQQTVTKSFNKKGKSFRHWEINKESCSQAKSGTFKPCKDPYVYRCNALYSLAYRC